MSRVAIYLNDANVAAASAAGVVRAPGFALLDGESIRTGEAAFAESRRHPRSVKNRFLYNLNVEPLTDQRFARLTPADLAAELLEKLIVAPADGRVDALFAVPGYIGRDALGVLLGVAAELGWQVAGLVDSAAAATRREYTGRQLVNIELGLHAAVVTLVAQADGAGVERREVVGDCALDTLRSAWLKTIAEAFVQQSRFDPLHDADTEQRLLDRLGEWLRAAVRDDHVDLVIPSGGLDHRATIDSIDLVNAAAPAWAALANAVRAMVAAGAPLALQFDSAAADLPGLTDYLAARTGGAVFMLPPDAAATGALARADAVAAQGSTRLVTALPWDQQAVAAPEAEAIDDTLAPTHVLRDATAFALGAQPLVIGAGAADEPNRVPLPANMPGVSQRHCTLQRQGQQIVVADHSRYGTFLNGNLIAGSAVLQAGDVVRVGTPGAEFQLIRVVQPDAA